MQTTTTKPTAAEIWETLTDASKLSIIDDYTHFNIEKINDALLTASKALPIPRSSILYRDIWDRFIGFRDVRIMELQQEGRLQLK